MSFIPHITDFTQITDGRFAVSSLLRWCVVVTALAAIQPIAAAPVYKNSSSDVTQTSADWVDAADAPVTPTADDVGHFGSESQSTLYLSTNVSLSGLVFDAVTTPATITIDDDLFATQLSLGADGITIDPSGNSVILSHALDLTASQTWNVGAGRSLTVDGVISGAPEFDLILNSASGPYAAGVRYTGSTANTYAGLTQLTLGALILDKDDGVTSLAGDVAATANGANVILASHEQIADSATVSLALGAKLILDGYNETIGGLMATGQTSLVQSTESASNRASKLTINVASDETYHFNGGILRDQSSGTNNALSLEKTGAGTQILEGRLVHTGTTTISEGTLLIRATGNAYHNGERSIHNWVSSIINNATLNLQHTNTVAFTESLNVAISGQGTLVKSGAGRINLSSTESTYSGVTVFEEGTLGVGSLADYGVDSSLGNRAADAIGDVGLLFRGGTLIYDGATAQSTNRAIRLGVAGGTINASGSDPAATLKFTAETSPDLFEGTGARTLTLTGSHTGMNEFNIQLTDELTNKTSLRKSGAGTWYITNSNNTYTGTTLFEGGVLNVASLADYGVASSLGARMAGLGPAGIDRIGLLFRGGTLQYTGDVTQSTNREIRISTSGGAYIDASGSNPDATLHFTAATSGDLYETGGARQLTLTGSNTGNNTFNTMLTDQSSATGKTTLNKTGAGSWALVNALANQSTYSGDTNIMEGILATHGFGIGNASLVRIANNATATLKLNGSEIIGALEGSGVVDLQSFALTVGGGDRSGSYDGIIIGSGDAKAVDLIKTGTGTQFLTSTDSTYGGFTMLEGGILNVAKIGNLGENSSIGNRASENVQSDVGLVFRGGTLQYTGATAQTTNRAMRVSTTGGAFLDASGANIDATLHFTRASSPDFWENSGDRQVTFTGTNQGNNTFDMAITQIGGMTSVNKTGLGTWRLGGTSTYTGTTNILEGSLLINGSIANSSVTVASGAVLGGTGNVGGPVVVHGMLSPGGDAKLAGHGFGAMTYSQTVSFAQGGSYFVQLGTDSGGGLGQSDRINTIGGITIEDDVQLLGSFTGLEEDRENNTRYWVANNDDLANVSGVFSNSEAWDWTGMLYQSSEASSYLGYKVNIDGIDFALFYDADFLSDSLFGGNDIVLVAVVPEPSKAMLLILGMVALIWRRRQLR